MVKAAACGSGRHGCGGGSRTRADRRWGRRFRTGAGRRTGLALADGARGPALRYRATRRFLRRGDVAPCGRRCAPSSGDVARYARSYPALSCEGAKPPHRARCARPSPLAASAGAAHPCRLPPLPVAGRLPPPTSLGSASPEMATAAAWGSGRHGCGGGSRTRDLQVMSLTRYHFSTPRWKAEGSRAPSLVKYGRPPKGPEPASQTRAETQKTQMHPAEWKARFRDFRPATGAEYPPERDLGPAVAPIFGPPGERTEDC